MAQLNVLSVVIFWTAVSLLVYVYLGYPALAYARRRFAARAVARGSIEPSVTVVIVAFNEAARIRRRIENLLESDYPRDRLTIVIGSDGSTDGTADRASAYADRGVSVRRFSQRRGKAAVLNELIAATKSEIIVLADARQRFEPAAIRALVENFADPKVGAVSGELYLRKRNDTSPSGEGAGFYWKYEKFIRACESASGSTVGATGAIYAIRRSLFEPIPEDTVLDDVLIPVRMVRRGYRVVFESGARAHDLISMSSREDFIRKTRTIAGTFQLFARDPWILNPRRSAVWFAAWSHKALRLAIPLLHVAAFAANLALIGHPWYRGLLVLQVMFYAAAIVGCEEARPERRRGARARRRHIFFTVPYTMCLLGWATIVGLGRFVARRQRVTWERMPGEPGPRVVSRPV